MLKLKSKPLVLILGIITITCHASDKYFICGSDGDACDPGHAKYCACIPYNESNAAKPYCLNFDEMSCTPLSQTPDCPHDFIYKNQGECLSTIYNSTPLPPCAVTTLKFCLDEQSAICDENGQPDSCK